MTVELPLQAMGWTPLLQHREIAQGFVSRLAVRNRVDLRQMMQDTGVRQADVERGGERATRKVAELGGLGMAKTDALIRFTPRRPREPGYGLPSVAGANLPAQSICLWRFRICPHCVADDLGTIEGPVSARPWLRLEWVMDHIRSCPRHHVALVSGTTVTGGYKRFDFSWAVAEEVLPRLDALRCSSKTLPSSPFEDWIMSRIDGVRDPSNWLDDVPLHAAIRFCEGLGISSLHKPKVAVSKLTESEWTAAGNEGLAIARGGEECIRQALGKLFDAQARTRGVLGLTDTYGYVCRVLSGEDPAFEKFRGVVRRHAFDNLPLESGSLVLGERLPKRRLHSIRSAALAADTTHQTMRRIFVRLGIAEAAADSGLRDHRVLIEADRIEAELAHYRDAVTTCAARAATGIPRLHLDEIIARGFIRTVFGSDAQAGAKHRLSKDDIRSFMRRLFDGAVPVTAPLPGRVDIMTARQVAGASIGDVVALIIGGRLTWKGRVGHGDRYERLLVDGSEVRTLLRTEPLRTGLTKQEAAKEIQGLRSDGVTTLVSEGLLDVTMEFCPLNRRRIEVLTRESVDAFKARYILFGEICRRTGLNREALRSALNGTGLTAVFSDRQQSTYIYERREIAGAGILGD